MWKSVVVIGLACQVFHMCYGQELNAKSRYEFTSDVSRVIGPKYLNSNFIISPVSLQTVLALAFLGSKGETSEELIKGLHLKDYTSKDLLAKEYGYFLQSIANDGGKIKMANRIYLDNGYDITPTFNGYATTYFQSGVEKVNFANADEAANTINNWVEEKTDNKIKNLIKPDALGPDTAAVLVNALHFKADWKNKFQAAITTDQEFSVSPQEKVTVPTMSSSPIYINYCQSPEMDLTAVELPYEETNLKMLLLLPNKVNGLPYLQTQATTANLNKLAQSCKAQLVKVKLPKFRIETDLDLKEHLENMGMKNIFSNEADFSGMLTTSKPLKISAAKQKIFISVDENGSEAAAATYVGISSYSAMVVSNYVEFNVDHPFAFAIRDDTAIYFVGHIIKPEFQ